tara:strand:+ start:992 stop:1366 length:375 start_codon:yes stop_codon:yes gene_type:complete
MKGIDEKSIKRATKAMKCLPFNLEFYKSIQISGLNALNVFQMQDQFTTKKSSIFKSSDQIENDFCWLIVLGVLRREVDGQGLTSRVRLTPLGRYIIERTPSFLMGKTTLIEKIRNSVFRKMTFQ